MRAGLMARGDAAAVKLVNEDCFGYPTGSEVSLFFSVRQPVSKSPNAVPTNSGNIYIGVGGWTFAPWRGVFYPEKLTQAKELEYAASKLTSIEINGTYYGSQKPESFRKWAREVRDGFVFSVKGPRFATNRRVLAE